MLDRLSKLLDALSEFLAQRKGLIPLLGVGLVVLNLIIQILPGGGFLKDSNLFLHLGVITSVIGILLGRAL